MAYKSAPDVATDRASDEVDKRFKFFNVDDDGVVSAQLLLYFVADNE